MRKAFPNVSLLWQTERTLVSNPFDSNDTALPVKSRMSRTNPVVRMRSNILCHRDLCSGGSCIGCPLDSVYHVRLGHVSRMYHSAYAAQRVELVTVIVAVLCCTIPETRCGGIVGFA